MKNTFEGTAAISIHFENRIMWQRYRKYILKTGWDFDGGQYPYTAVLDVEFKCIDDVNDVLKKVVFLLTLGFDVYSCKWTLKRTPEDMQYPDEEDIDLESLYKITCDEKYRELCEHD